MAGETTSQRLVGLRNEHGAQNCFLNVVLQALWRQKASRDFFCAMREDPHRKRNPILSSLTMLFTALNFSDEMILPPDLVRIALADMYAHLNRFQLGEMDDAGESLEAILSVLHGTEHERPCKEWGICLGHQVFALEYLKLKLCKGCGANEQVGFGSMFTHHVYVQEVLNHGIGSITEAIRNLYRSDYNSCEECRGSFSRTEMFLLSMPKVLCINLVWPATDAGGELRETATNLIAQSTKLQLENSFQVLSQHVEGSFPSYALSGIICFYPGGHYVFFGLVRNSWFIFDDHEFKFVGSIDDVLDRCIRAKYQPVCLFYEQQETSKSTLQGSLSNSPRSHQTSAVPSITHMQDERHRYSSDQSGQFRRVRSRSPPQVSQSYQEPSGITDNILSKGHVLLSHLNDLFPEHSLPRQMLSSLFTAVDERNGNRFSEGHRVEEHTHDQFQRW